MSTENKQPEEKKSDKKEKSWGEQLAENIAGDNEMMKNVIKFLAHPVVLFTGGFAILWWIMKDKERKTVIEQIEKENRGMKEKLEKLEKRFLELEKNNEMIKQQLLPGAKEQPALPEARPVRALPPRRKYGSAYLD